MSDEQNAYPQWSGSDVEPTYAQAVQFARTKYDCVLSFVRIEAAALSRVGGEKQEVQARMVPVARIILPTLAIVELKEMLDRVVEDLDG